MLKWTSFVFVVINCWALLPLPVRADSADATTSVHLDSNLTWIETPSARPMIDRGPASAWDHYAVDNPYERQDRIYRAVLVDH